MNLIAHRGLHSKNTKENTLEAIELGNRHEDIDGVEIDVRLTKDNQVVVIHDEYIDRVSNGSGRINEMSLGRLKRFNYGTRVKPSTVNSLSEVLDKISPDTLLVIELKDEREKNDILASKVIEIVNQYPLLNIWLKSFSFPKLLQSSKLRAVLHIRLRLKPRLYGKSPYCPHKRPLPVRRHS